MNPVSKGVVWLEARPGDSVDPGHAADAEQDAHDDHNPFC